MRGVGKMNTKPLFSIAATSMWLFNSTPATAYVGPGVGLSAIGSILAFLGVVFLMIAGFVWYPIKRAIARFKKDKAENETHKNETQ